MSNQHTFHTPSFGDEEFHLPQIQNSALMGREQMNVNEIGSNSGVQAVCDMTTTNINSSAADMQSAIAANSVNSQWPTFNQANSMKSAADVVTLTGNEFLVLRSPTQQATPIIPSSDHLSATVSHATPATGLMDQTASSDESDDNGLGKSGNRSPGTGAAIIDLKSKMKNDPNAPRKPVSAYALFFGDTQAAIKSQNPNASFTEISKIVASMWDVLSAEHKEVYKKKAEDAKKEYRRLMTTYRANLLAKSDEELNQKTDKPAPQTAVPIVQQVQSVSDNFPAVNSAAANQQSTITTAVTSDLQESTVSQNSVQNVETSGDNHTNSVASTQTCIRKGCDKVAVVSPDWEDEYCSNECVVTHCAEIFSRWVQDNSTAETYAAS